MSEENSNNTENTLPEGVVQLTAEDGYVYTNHQIVGKTIYCIEDVKDTFVQVTEEEGNAIQEEINRALEENSTQPDNEDPE